VLLEAALTAEPRRCVVWGWRTKEKTLHAGPGGHTGTPWFEVDDAARFFAGT
jgi:hypothetical protein